MKNLKQKISQIEIFLRAIGDFLNSKNGIGNEKTPIFQKIPPQLILNISKTAQMDNMRNISN